MKQITFLELVVNVTVIVRRYPDSDDGRCCFCIGEPCVLFLKMYLSQVDKYRIALDAVVEYVIIYVI